MAVGAYHVRRSLSLGNCFDDNDYCTKLKLIATMLASYAYALGMKLNHANVWQHKFLMTIQRHDACWP